MCVLYARMSIVPYKVIASKIIEKRSGSYDLLVEYIRDSGRAYKKLDPQLLSDEILRQIESDHSIPEIAISRIHFAFRDVFHFDLITHPLHTSKGDRDEDYEKEAIECFSHVDPEQAGNLDAINFLRSLGHNIAQYRTGVIKLLSAIKKVIRDRHPYATIQNTLALNHAFFTVFGMEIIRRRQNPDDKPQTGPSTSARPASAAGMRRGQALEAPVNARRTRGFDF